ncbi:MAG: VOC family protein [Phototrophicaceae bacterium]
MPITAKIVPCLWFHFNCEEAIQYYVSVFNGAPHSENNSQITSIQRYESDMNTPFNSQMVGKVIAADLVLAGQKFRAFDGGNLFTFNESISMVVDCQDQAEVDYFWEKLSAVPSSEQCGWCKDSFGLSWQIIPKQLGELMSNPDQEKSSRVVNAMLQMKKIIVADLERAVQD